MASTGTSAQTTQVKPLYSGRRKRKLKVPKKTSGRK